MISVALALVAKKRAGARWKALMGPAFRDLTRLADSSAEMWEQIASTNSEWLGASTKEYVDILNEINRAIRSGRLKSFFSNARKFKNSITLNKTSIRY